MKIAVFICFIALLGVPFIFRPEAPPPPADALQLIIITPHNEQIRYEFGRGFDEWHTKKHGKRVNVIFNVPGGTSEIRKMLESEFTAAIESGREPGGNADLMFGGGSFEFKSLKKGVRISADRYEPIIAPPPGGFTDEWLTQTFGDNRVGDDPIYDKDLCWFGAAFSGFGIVYNRDSLRSLDIREPTRWADLCDPKLQGNVALVNPAQSGSITTAFDAILKRSGWIKGWQILRRAAANSRYFSGSSLKPPIDVSQGQAAMGVCIDFYGRFQSQAMKEAGHPERVGYIDPPTGSIVDVDPIAMLRNPPHPELAKRFIEFVLSEEGQALWQYHKRGDANPDELGPHRFELRRLPVLKSMYEPQRFSHFVDQENPYLLATPLEYNDPNFRDFIAPMFAAMAMDIHHELKAAWKAIVTHPAYPTSGELIGPEDVSDPALAQMILLFDQMPTIAGPDRVSFFMNDTSKLGDIRNGWLKEKWKDNGLWNSLNTPADEMRRRFGEFFRENYRKVVDMNQSPGTPVPGTVKTKTSD